MASATSPSSRALLTLVCLFSLYVLFFFLTPTHEKIVALHDEMDDLSLFHKAVAMDTPNYFRRPAAKSRLSSAVQIPKIVFLFLTNSDLQFAPLWERFFSSASAKQYNIYVHADPFVKMGPLEGVFKDRVIPSKRTQRASPSLISAARRLLATAMLDDRANMYFAVISQHCIPLHSFKYFYSFLFDLGRLSRDLSFSSYIEILDKEPTLWSRYNARGENVMLPEVNFEEFRVGSQFFVLTREHALMVVKDRKLWRKFRLPCLDVHSCYPEEHYFPTMLSMQDPNGCTQHTLTRVNWTNSVDGHPHTYLPSEVSPELIHTLRNSSSRYNYMFARKFSPDCLKPLMEIAESVIFKD